jgi:Glycosyl hydrolase family 26
MKTLPFTAPPRVLACAQSAALSCLLVLALAIWGTPARAAGRAPDRAAAGHERHVEAHKRKTKPRPAYWGAWIGSQLTGTQPPWDMSAVTRFEQLVGKGLSLVELASPFANCNTSPCRYYDFPTPQMQAIRSYGAIPVFSWSSSASPETANQQPYKLANVINGNLDAYIRHFAEDARDWGHPFFLRFNWEMNGNWFPWSEGVNGNGPGEFVAAWRHVHDVFTSVGATNASWVWCPFADPSGKFGRIGRFYPGDGYVDWTCMDGYNWASNPTNPHPWRSFEQIFASTYRTLTQDIAPKKPVMLAEIASTGNGRSKAAWIRKMFKLLKTDYRRTRAVIWYDQIDRGIDWPLETSPLATGAFARGIRHPAFATNSQAAISTSPIPPPR